MNTEMMERVAELYWQRYEGKVQKAHQKALQERQQRDFDFALVGVAIGVAISVITVMGSLWVAAWA